MNDKAWSYDNAVTDLLEAALAADDDDGLMPDGRPWPCTAHPFYRRYRREHIVRWLDTMDQHWWNVPLPPVIPRIVDGQPVWPDRMWTTLDRRTAWVPAPYIGEPFMYRWNYGIDKYGRTVAGELVRRHYESGRIE